MRTFKINSLAVNASVLGLLCLSEAACLAGTTMQEIQPSPARKAGYKNRPPAAHSAPSQKKWIPVKKSRKSRGDFRPVATFDDPYGDEQVQEASDLFEGANRLTFRFNDQFYKYVAKPLARGTKFVLREPGLEAAENVFQNAAAPVRIVSSLLQGKLKRSGQETGKLLVNSTLGVGGLWKVSERIDALKRIPSEDVGQTFGTWGIPAGPYLVLPILGPSNVRDLAGRAGDTCLDPLTWVGGSALKSSVRGSKIVVENPGRMETYDNATADALDPYISMREAYTSFRKAAVQK